MKKWGALLGLLLVLQAASLALYLGRAGQPGFPLDDAWIHQTYARNLGLHGVMAFSPGIPSTGSTSFLWTLLLAAGYFLKLPFYAWTYFLGGLFGVATAFLAALLNQDYFDNFRNSVIIAVLCMAEWHLAWAGVSGMETGLFTCLTLLFFLLLKRGVSPYLLGGLAGIVVLVRPEGILLALVYGLHLLLTRRRDVKRMLLDGAAFLLLFLIVMSPWILFNLSYSGRPFPNTISAKFMQYGYPPSVERTLHYFWDVLIYFLNGPLLLLAPGAGYAIYSAIRIKNLPLLYGPLWSLSLIGLYAVALPVIYDQGRYLMPIIPFIIVYGVEGLDRILHLLSPRSTVLRAAVWTLLFGMMFVLWVNGASDFSYRVRLFDAVHISAARWINDHAAEDAVLATHDIGIIGYETERQIVDLAGLVTTEIVPLMDDPAKMAEYLRERDVSYMLVYSGYYRDLLTLLNAKLVFSPGAEQLRALGVEPFEVYEIGR